MIKTKNNLIAFGLTMGLVLASLTVLSVNVRAEDSATSGGSGTTLSAEKKAEIEKKRTEREAERAKKQAERQAEIDAKQAEIEKKADERQAKLDANKLEACKKKEASINSAMKKIAEQRAKQADVFDKIADRTMAFHDEKNLTVANYDALVKTVTDKRAAVDAEIANIKKSTVDFKCDSADPLKVSDTFKSAREGLMTAMKDYKTSVKDLIVAVKQAAEKTSSTESGAN